MKRAPLALLAVLAAPAVAETVLYRATEIHAVSGPALAPGQMLVKDNRIEAVGKKLEVPQGTKTVDLGDLRLYPGLIAAPTSLGLTEINAVRATRDDKEVGEFTPDVEAWVAVNPDSELIPVARANGITHSVVAPMGGTISGTSGLIALDGWGVEEMTIRKKVALHLWWPGHGFTLPQPNATGDSKPKSIKEQTKERERRVREIDEFFNQAEAYKRTKATKPKVLPNSQLEKR